MSGGDHATMLVTGATGAVGHEIVERARERGWAVTGCSRRGGPAAVPWDMNTSDLPRPLDRHWDAVVHTAARPRWNLPPEVAHVANVGPLAALEGVVRPGTRLVHLSTAFAVGRGRDTGSEDPVDFRNSYEWSKAAAERGVRERFPDAAIIRPPLVIGRRSDGHIAHHNGVYLLLRAAVTGMLPAFVGERDSPAEIVSSCDVADCVLRAVESPAACRVLGRGAETLSVSETVDRFFVALNGWRTGRGIPPCPQPPLIPGERWTRFMLPYISPMLTDRQRRGIDLLAEFIPYFSLDGPIVPDEEVAPMGPVIETAVRAWADAFPRLAVRRPAPWTPG